MADPYEIAAWRFEQIAPFVDESLDPVLVRAAWGERTTRSVEWPLSDDALRRGRKPLVKPVAPSTLRRWIAQYKELGFPALLPKTGTADSEKDGGQRFLCCALGMLYEQPHRSLTQIHCYLEIEHDGYHLSRSGLHRRLREHPAYQAILLARKGRRSKKLRHLYEASAPHECWQLDGKGRFRVQLVDGTRVTVTVLTILDDFSRAVLAVLVAASETERAAIKVFQMAAQRWGFPDRMQFDRGSAFDSHLFRQGLSQCGTHRNAVEVRSPEYQAKVERYHRVLDLWFVRELRAQEVHDLAHLQQLLEATIAILYQRHIHRELGQSPEDRLAGRISSRRLSPTDLAHAFLQPVQAKSHVKTGQVKLPNGMYKVQRPYAGRRARFLFDPIREGQAFLLDAAGNRIALQTFEKRPLPKPQVPPRGTGQLQKLVDVWQGRQRPNAQPGFGLPEVFQQMEKLLGRRFPASEKEASDLAAFYRKHGPLPAEPFLRACESIRGELGEGRPLATYIEHLERRIRPSDDS